MLKTAGSTTDQRSRASFYLARAFEASRELDRAEAKCLDGIAQTEKNFGPHSYIAAFGYENDGDLLRQMSRFDEAWIALAECLIAQNQPQSARALLDEAAIAPATHPRAHALAA